MKAEWSHNNEILGSVMRGIVIDILSQIEEQFCCPSEYLFYANTQALELWLVLMLDVRRV